MTARLFTVVFPLLVASLVDVSSAQYSAEIIAGAEVAEFDPAPDEDFRFNGGPTAIPLSAFAQRATADATSQASGSVDGTSTLRAHAFTQTSTNDFTEGGPQAAGVDVTVSDTVFFDRDGVPVGGGVVELRLSFSGSESSSGNATATVRYTIDVGPGLGTNPDTGEADSLLLLELFGSSSFDFRNELGGLFDVPDLQGQGLSIIYSLGAGVTGGSGGTQATADASNSASVFLQFLDESGEPDPTVAVTSASGIDYTPPPIPEPTTSVLLLSIALTRLSRRTVRPC